VSDQKILVSGQLNFYKSFIGLINATTGSFMEAYTFPSENTDYKVGYASYALDMGSLSGDIYAGLNYLGSPYSIARIERAYTDSQGRKYQASISWVKNIGTSTVTPGSPLPSMCVDDQE
jgi:hypothetical protein